MKKIIKVRLKALSLVILAPYLFISAALADVRLVSPSGSALIFSDKKTEKNYDRNAWGQLFYEVKGKRVNLSIEGRYFVEDGSSRLSPSGRYFVVNSVAGGYVDMFDGRGEQYVDKAYCSVIDMRTGCIISDWDGEACGYDWKKDSDELASSDEPNAEKFDFLTFRPDINKPYKQLSSLTLKEVNGYLRCDPISKDNISTWQRLAKENKVSQKNVDSVIVDFIKSLRHSATISMTTYLHSLPDNASVTRSYLIPGDNVKVIQTSKDQQWLLIGYITTKSRPLAAWIKRESLQP